MSILRSVVIVALAAAVEAVAHVGYAADVFVRVVDAARSPIADAHVTIDCRGLTATQMTTGADGGVFLDAEDDCTATIAAPGFVVWHGTVERLRELMTVRLAIAPFEQRVEVRGVAQPLRWASLASTWLDGEDMTRAGRDPERVLRYAKARAGATLAEDRIYVDGLPAAVLPTSHTLATLAINADPFSVLYSESDQNVVDVVSAEPDRRFTWSGGYTSKEVGARNPLDHRMRARRTLGGASLSGPVPHTPMTFAADMNVARVSEDRPLFGDAPRDTAEREGAHVEATSRMFMGALVGRWRNQVRTRLSIALADTDDRGAEAGGFVQPEAATRHSSSNREARVVVDAGVGRYRYRSGLVYSTGAHAFVASPSSPSIVVLDVATSGAPAFGSMHLRNVNWTWNNTVSSPTSSSLVGWSLARATDIEALERNPYGQLMFGTVDEYARWLEGGRSGTWYRVALPLRQQISSTTAAVYGQQEWQIGPGTMVRTGARADYQARDGLRLTPRVSLAASRDRATISSGIGIFRQGWTNPVLLQGQRFGSGRHRRMAVDVLRDRDADTLWIEAQPLDSLIDPAFTRPGAVVTRNRIELRFGSVSPGIEYAWTAAFARPGSRRVANAAGWVDRLESTRRLRRHQLHARVGYEAQTFSLVAHYEWLVSRDDSDGPFSFPERQDDLAPEWARSAGIAPHTVSIVANLPKAVGVDACIVLTSRSAAPLDFRTGLDVDATRLYGDRGGSPRNSGTSPAFRSLDAYAHRLLRIPGTSMRLDASLYADNLLGTRNYVTLGTIVASRSFSQPVVALPGRSVRLAFRLAR